MMYGQKINGIQYYLMFDTVHFTDLDQKHLSKGHLQSWHSAVGKFYYLHKLILRMLLLVSNDDFYLLIPRYYGLNFEIYP